MGVPFTNSIIPVIHIVPVDADSKRYITIGDVLGNENVLSPFIPTDYFDFAGFFIFKRFDVSMPTQSFTIEIVDPTFAIFEKVLALVNRVSGSNAINKLWVEVTLGWAFKNKTASDIVYPRDRSDLLRVGGRLRIEKNELLGTKYNCDVTKMQYSVQTNGIHYTLSGNISSHIEEQVYSQSTEVMPTDCQYLTIMYKLAAEMNLLLLIDDSCNVNQLRATAKKFAFENKKNIDNFLRVINAVNEPGPQYRPLDVSISNQEDDARAALTQISGMYKNFTRSTDVVNYSSITSILNNNAYAYENPVAINETGAVENEIASSASGKDIQTWNISAAGGLYTDSIPLQGKTGNNLTAEQQAESLAIDQFLSNANKNTTQSIPNSNELMAEGFDLVSVIKNVDISKSDREKQILSESIQKIMTHWNKVSAGEYKDWKTLIITEQPNLTNSSAEDLISGQTLDFNLRGKLFLGVYAHFAKDQQELDLSSEGGRDTSTGFSFTSNFNIDDTFNMMFQERNYQGIGEHCGKQIDQLIDLYNLAYGNSSATSLTSQALQNIPLSNRTTASSVSRNITAIRNKPLGQQLDNNLYGINEALKSSTSSNIMGIFNASADEMASMTNDTKNQVLDYIKKMLDLPQNTTQSDIYKAGDKRADCSLAEMQSYFKGPQYNYFLKKLNNIERNINEHFQSTINPEASTIKLIQQVTKLKLCETFRELQRSAAYSIFYQKAAMQLTLRTIGDIALSQDLCTSGTFLYLKFFNPNGTLNRFLTGFYMLLNYKHELNSESMFTTEMQLQYYNFIGETPAPTDEPGNSTQAENTGNPVQFNNDPNKIVINNNNNNDQLDTRSYNSTGTTIITPTINSVGEREAIFQTITDNNKSTVQTVGGEEKLRDSISKGMNLNLTNFTAQVAII